MSDPFTIRPYRSKIQRPCDRCRRRKTVCLRQAAGESCQSCVKAQQTCAFAMPPMKRHRRETDVFPEISNHTAESGPSNVVTLHTSPAARVIGQRNITPSPATSPVVDSRHRNISANELCHQKDNEIVGVAEASGMGEASDSLDVAAPEDTPHLAEDSLEGFTYTHQLRRASTAVTSTQTTISHAVQYVQSLDQINGATAQLCGLSAELDPWLLRHGNYDKYGIRHFQNIDIRNVGGVPVQGLVPVHFIVTKDSLLVQTRDRFRTEAAATTNHRRREMEKLVPVADGMRFLKFIFPMMPIISQSQLSKQLSQNNVPTVILAAIYASAMPYKAHDHRLFVTNTYNESLSDQLWHMVYDQVCEEMHKPKLAVIQASLLYLTRMPAHHQQNLSDTPSRSSFLGSTVALAMSLGLHLESQPWGIPAWEKRLRRRLWWAVYMEDKWTSLLLGRPPMIREDEWDVWDLDESDFEGGEPIHLDQLPQIEWCHRDLIFPYFVKLSQLADQIHRTFYTLRASQKLSEDFRASVDAARPIRQGLQNWYSRLPEELRLKPRLEGHSGHSRQQGVAALHFSYLTLELFLSRAIIRPLAQSPPPPPVSREDKSPSPVADQMLPDTLTSPWFLDDLTLDNLMPDQLPAVGFAEYGDAAEVTLNAAEKCAGIIVKFVSTLVVQDFDVLWYPWIRTGFATVTNFIALLLVQAPTVWHAARSKELFERWSLHLRSQHKCHEALMTLGLLRLHSLQAEGLGHMFKLSQAAVEVITDNNMDSSRT